MPPSVPLSGTDRHISATPLRVPVREMIGRWNGYDRRVLVCSPIVGRGYHPRLSRRAWSLPYAAMPTMGGHGLWNRAGDILKGCGSQQRSENDAKSLEVPRRTADDQKQAMGVGFDALMPAEMAAKAENVGVRKAELPIDKLFLLAILAGAFIGLGAEFATAIMTGTYDKVGYGLTRLIGGLVFSLGLILAVVVGAELFTGNALIVMAYASRKVSTWQLLRNWGVVYVGNFAGALLTAYLLFLTNQYMFEKGAVGATALNIANSKCALEFWPALFLGVYCNALVCLAVWLAFTAEDGQHAIRDVRPDVVVVDIGMETESAGLDLAKGLRTHPSTRDLPIVLVSGTTIPHEHSADRFLEKPLQFSLLRKTINEALAERANRR